MSDLLFSVENGIARITLNRPDKLNAFSTEMIDLWIDALETVRDSDDIRVVLLNGNGRAFCSGGDVKSMINGEGFLYNNTDAGDLVTNALARKNSLWKRVQRIPLILQEIDKPVIAVIHGLAIGAGLDMALACDIRIAAQSTKMAESYVKAGIVPGDGGAFLLPRLIGLDKALEMLWTGDFVSAEEAKKLGLVTHVVPDKELDDFVESYIQKLVEGPQEVMRFIKRAVYQGLRMDLRSSLDYISSAMGIVTELDDYHEGIKAISEKRTPIFK
ncbi:enoyl-CoA hydratase-related protein [Brevibacillus brevis]|uniref:Enoyl-CoA hydratase-related protein n=1 Tax=Brevibacillus brevis TaxID=1393 RepID=A0ABY9SWT9_BREBE|nr:enoyl-CoA hydratase-related protein [Brevibacillus brevis]WNC12279.1 enoyl-CoA hydratase-related protein [Brevibacillus brevis]